MRTVICLVIFGSLLMSSSVAQAQGCGDVTQDSALDVRDFAYLIDYLSWHKGPPPPDSIDAEMDSRIGISLADAVFFMNYLFRGGPPPVCGAAVAYSFDPSAEDTIFLPRMTNIPDVVNKVSLPLTASLRPGSYGLYLPLLLAEVGNSGHFVLDDFIPGTGPIIPFSVTSGADTALVQMYNHVGLTIDTTVALGTLVYTRVNPGFASIMPSAFDLPGVRHTAVEYQGDLLTPTIVYVDIELPPDTLLVDPDSLHFNVTAGDTVVDTQFVSFTSSGAEVAFDLTASDSWITVVPPPLWMPPGFNTPSQIGFAIDHSQLPIGDYSGWVAVEAASPDTETPVDTIGVTVTVNEPSNVIPGDVDCNGVVDIGDITVLTLYLFMGSDPPPPCE